MFALLAEPAFWVGTAILGGLGYAINSTSNAIDATGNTVQKTGNSASQVIIVGALALYGLYKAGVIKGGIKV